MDTIKVKDILSKVTRVSRSTSFNVDQLYTMPAGEVVDDAIISFPEKLLLVQSGGNVNVKFDIARLNLVETFGEAPTFHMSVLIPNTENKIDNVTKVIELPGDEAWVTVPTETIDKPYYCLWWVTSTDTLYRTQVYRTIFPAVSEVDYASLAWNFYGMNPGALSIPNTETGIAIKIVEKTIEGEEGDPIAAVKATLTRNEIPVGPEITTDIYGQAVFIGSWAQAESVKSWETCQWRFEKEGFETEYKPAFRPIKGIVTMTPTLKMKSSVSGPGDTTITIAAILGVTPPVTGESPVAEITECAQYTGNVSWEAPDDPFLASTVYTATIDLIAKEGWTLVGVAENFFTVEGILSPATNAPDDGIVTAIFPVTDPA